MNPLIAAAIHDAKNDLHVLAAKIAEAHTQAPSPSLSEAQAIAGHINSQLMELLAVYRASEGKLSLAIDDRDLRDFIEELQIEPGLQQTAQPKIDIVWKLDATEQIVTWAFDAYQVKLVLLDALRNALRHAQTQVSFELLAGTHGGIEFIVSDDGTGFPAEVLDGEDTAMRADSSGLGLLFARLIADRHLGPKGRRGQVALDNQGIDRGARFALHLP